MFSVTVFTILKEISKVIFIMVGKLGQFREIAAFRNVEYILEMFISGATRLEFQRVNREESLTIIL